MTNPTTGLGLSLRDYLREQTSPGRCEVSKMPVEHSGDCGPSQDRLSPWDGPLDSPCPIV